MTGARTTGLSEREQLQLEPERSQQKLKEAKKAIQNLPQLTAEMEDLEKKEAALWKEIEASW